MQLTINGKREEIGAIATLPELLSWKNLPGQQVVIELNGEIVPRERWETVVLQPDDVLEILRFVGGG